TCMPTQGVGELGAIDRKLAVLPEVVLAKSAGERCGFTPEPTREPDAVSAVVCGARRRWPYQRHKHCAIQELRLGDPDSFPDPDPAFAGEQIEEVATFAGLVIVPAAALGAGQAEREGATAAPPHVATGFGGRLAQQSRAYDICAHSKSACNVGCVRMWWGCE